MARAPRDQRHAGPAALIQALRSWLRQEKSSLPSPATLRAALLTSLLALSPLLGIELLRRASVIRQAKAQEREQALEIVHAAQAAMVRTTRDWAHWDDTYAYVTGRNPDYVRRHITQTPIFDDGSVMMFFSPAGRLLHSHSRPGGTALADQPLIDCAEANLPRLANPAQPAAINAVVALLCTGKHGDNYLGILSPISDSQAMRPAHGTLAFLSPLLRSDYGAHLRETVAGLQRDVVLLPATASGTRALPTSAIETVTGGRLHSSGGRLVSLRPQGIWLEMTRSLAEQSLLLLSLLLLLLLVRATLMLDRRRQLVGQRRQEIQANRRIRRICKELDALLVQMGVDTAQSPPDARVLARLIDRDRPSAGAIEAPLPSLEAATRLSGESSLAGAAESEDRKVSERLGRITERFQYFLGSARQLALCDALTQLPNRRYFLEYLSLEAERQRAEQGQFAILFVDIDKFKAINDTYGHAVGDQALVAVAERLRRLLRADDFLARYGGDEFVMLLPLKPLAQGDDAELRRDVYGFANRVASSFSEVLHLDSAALEINLSIGVAMVNPAEINPQEAIQRSDEAMYRAKLHKTSRIAIFSVDEQVRPHDNYLLYVDLITAARERELSIQLQPLVDSDGRTWALEALARWIHPQQGEIGPDHFIDLAERYRQMPLLGQALLERSLEAFNCVTRQAAEPEASQLRLNLNLSPSQLPDPQLAEQIGGALQRHGLKPQHLTIELTETAMLDHNPTVRDNLKALRQMGIRLAIDDFGMGYSSLHLLQSLRPDEVKIDQTFIQGMTQDAYARRIVGLLASMAPLMGVEIVAEGVENETAYSILREMGVTRFQGYLFSPPLAPERFSGLRFPAAIGTAGEA